MAIPNPNPAVGSGEVATELEDALAGALYPLSRRELVLVARENEAGEALLALLSSLPDTSFQSEQDVSDEVSSSSHRTPAE